MALGKAHHENVESSTEPIHFPEKDHLANTRSNSVVIRNAKAATEKEHSMSLLQGIKLYPKAVGWSMLISLCIAMEGFDLSLLGTFCMFYSYVLLDRSSISLVARKIVV
jgi:MFS transporter, SP family, general alpha glucoside:H+ symporter